MDAFYASIEQRDNPEYKGKPIAVGGSPEGRGGVVATASDYSGESEPVILDESEPP
jgi:nucleotidyltransferase/DNA polymerase involved in DNA repair